MSSSTAIIYVLFQCTENNLVYSFLSTLEMLLTLLINIQLIFYYILNYILNSLVLIISMIRHHKLLPPDNTNESFMESDYNLVKH